MQKPALHAPVNMKDRQAANMFGVDAAVMTQKSLMISGGMI